MDPVTLRAKSPHVQRDKFIVSADGKLGTDVSAAPQGYAVLRVGCKARHGLDHAAACQNIPAIQPHFILFLCIKDSEVLPLQQKLPGSLKNHVCFHILTPLHLLPQCRLRTDPAPGRIRSETEAG